MTIWLALKFDVFPFLGTLVGNCGFENWWLYFFKLDYVQFDNELYSNWKEYLKEGFGFKVRILTIVEFGISQ